MQCEYDARTGRPLTNGRVLIPALTDEEIEAEVTIAAAESRWRSARLEALLRERSQRRRRTFARLV